MVYVKRHNQVNVSPHGPNAKRTTGSLTNIYIYRHTLQEGPRHTNYYQYASGAAAHELQSRTPFDQEEQLLDLAPLKAPTHDHLTPQNNCYIRLLPNHRLTITYPPPPPNNCHILFLPNHRLTTIYTTTNPK